VLYDEVEGTLRAVSNAETEGMDHGAGLQTAKKVLDLAPDVIITGNGPGNKALDILKRSKIAMYVGANGMTLKEAYDAFRAGELTQFQQ
jgi:predicted Fe-Mo cluster-binding NifX family protein